MRQFTELHAPAGKREETVRGKRGMEREGKGRLRWDKTGTVEGK